MLDIGWSELFVIGVVALIVVGPKDLPVMFRTLGRFTAKARSMGREFQRAMDKAADDSGMKGVAKDLRAVTSPSALGIDALQNAASRFEKWDPLKPTPKPAVTAASAAVDPVATDPVPSIMAKPAEGSETAALAAKRAADQAALLQRFAKPEAPAAPAAKRAPRKTAVSAPAAPAKPAAKPRKTNVEVAAAEPAAKPKTPRTKKSSA